MMHLISGVALAVGGSLAASLVAKVTVTTAIGLMAAWLARGTCAAVRHVVLVATLGVTLVLPIASMVAPRVRVAVPVMVDSRTPPDSLVEAVAANPISQDCIRWRRFDARN
jgi:hypothetical protein